MQRIAAPPQLLFVVEGVYIQQGAREPQSTTPDGRGGGGCSLITESRRSRPRNLGRAGRRRRGAQEDAVAFYVRLGPLAVLQAVALSARSS
jgi:hypothetical protein